MADLDIEAMLEAPFKAAEAAKKEVREQNGDDRMDEDKEEEEEEEKQKEEKSSRSRSEKKGDEEKRSSKEKKEKSRRKSRSRSRDRSRSRSRSRSRDRQREKEKSRKDKDKDREREKDRARDKDRDREREKEKDKSRSRRKSRSRSRDRDRDRRRRSRTRSRSRSRDRSRRRHSRSRSRDRDRERRRRSPSRERRRSRSRSRSRERSSRRERERTPLTENERKIKDYISSLSKEDRAKLDDEIDRTERSLICMQLSVKLRDKELMEFFMSNDVLVRDARIISDRNSRRSKGIAYVELLKKEDMQRALSLSGQKLLGVPILIQYSQAEKNRQAGQTTVGPTKIYVASLHSNLSESDIKNIFQPFGDIDGVSLQKDNSGRSQGFCFINFKKPDHAKLAIEQMNGFELAGKKLKVGWENEKNTIDSVDDEADRGGVAMTSQSRLELMQKLAQSKDVGMPVPAVMSPGLFPSVPAVPGVSAPGVAGVLPFVPAAAAVVPGAVPGVAQPSQCLMLRNMFDPNKEKDEHWAEDLEEDVEDEASNYGKVVHIHVDRDSKQGAVYLKYDQVASATAAFTKLNGRWFDGQMIIAEYIPVETYAEKFPSAP